MTMEIQDRSNRLSTIRRSAAGNAGRLNMAAAPIMCDWRLAKQMGHTTKPWKT
jgi:hypothetical protein